LEGEWLANHLDTVSVGMMPEDGSELPPGEELFTEAAKRRLAGDLNLTSASGVTPARLSVTFTGIVVELEDGRDFEIPIGALLSWGWQHTPGKPLPQTAADKNVLLLLCETPGSEMVCDRVAVAGSEVEGIQHCLVHARDSFDEEDLGPDAAETTGEPGVAADGDGALWMAGEIKMMMPKEPQAEVGSARPRTHRPSYCDLADVSDDDHLELELDNDNRKGSVSSVLSVLLLGDSDSGERNPFNVAGSSATRTLTMCRPRVSISA
jgi:hypothetical protein